MTDGTRVGWLTLVESGCKGRVAEGAGGIEVGGEKVATSSKVGLGVELIAVVVGDVDSPDGVGSEPALAVQADRTITTAIFPKIVPILILSIALNFTIKTGYAQYSINIQS